MKIRGKLLILLLVIAVTPLLFTAFYGFVTLRNMGNTLADKTGDAMQTRMKHQLQLMVQYNAKMLRQQGDLVEAWLELLAEAAEKALETKNPVSGPAYLAEDFDLGRVPRSQTQSSPNHFQAEPSGRQAPMLISTDAQVLNLAPGVNAEAVADSIIRLSSLTQTYKSGYEQYPELLFWIYTSLENGVHSAFPGHGGYPDGYDGRDRPWYANAVSAGESVWSNFIVDASTRQAIATISRPIFYADSRLAGVVGIDVPVQAMLNKIRLQAEISSDAKVFMVKAHDQDGSQLLQLLAALEGDLQDWRKVRQNNILHADHEQFDAMVDDIAAGSSGVRRLQYKDEDSVWAYGVVGEGAFGLIIVFPFTEVAQRVQEAKDYVTDQTLSIASIVGLFVLVLVGVIIAAAWGSSLSITGPVRALAGAARRLATGDFEVRVPERSNDEIGQLSRVFNEIAPQLLDRMKARESLAHLGRYFSPNLAEQLTENPELLNVGGERRELTFVFTDLAGFTGLVEASKPEDIVPILNKYLDGLTRIVWEHEGTIDKVVGDAVHAMFGAPILQPDQASRALRCARAIDGYAESFRARMKDKGVDIGITRIGINTGQATVGNFGGELMFDYTAHGDAINTAARLESANKYFGTRITISENTTRLIEGFTGRPIGKLILKGRSTGLKTFEPLSAEDFRSPRIRAYLEAYTLLAHEERSALEAFNELYELYPDDPLTAFHRKRLLVGEIGEIVVLGEK